MASSSSQRDATMAPPPPDQLASFYSLCNKGVIAGVLCRYARDAELRATAAVQGEALFGGDSLVVAHLRMRESMTLVGLAVEASGAEQYALRRRSWGALVFVILILQRRIGNDTLLPGTIRKEEFDYYARQLTAMFSANKQPVSDMQLHATASTIGFAVLLDALHRSLSNLRTSFHPFWPDAQIKNVELFVRAFPILALTCVLTRTYLFRSFKAWTSSPTQPIYSDIDFLEKTPFWLSLNTWTRKTMSPRVSPPCSASGDLMR